MATFRKKPVEIEALQWDGNWGVDGRPDWVRAGGYEMTTDRELVISTREGVRYAAPGDWIIRCALGEIYLCKPHIFEATYDAVRE